MDMTAIMKVMEAAKEIMRNFLIHGYHNVEEDLVWEAIAVDLQPIREKIVKYLEGFDKCSCTDHLPHTVQSPCRV